MLWTSLGPVSEQHSGKVSDKLATCYGGSYGETDVIDFGLNPDLHAKWPLKRCVYTIVHYKLHTYLHRLYKDS